MKIEVAKSDLEAALKIVGITVGSGNDLSSHYLFRYRDGACEVMSYDMRVFSRAPLLGSRVEASEGEAVTAEAWRLDKWISSVGSGALTLSSGEGGEVIAKGPRSRIKLRSLDASRFPFWDGLLSTAKSLGNANPSILHRAINLSKVFVSSDDTNRPEICQIEARGGVIQATNRRAVSNVTVQSVPDLALRISGKDLTVALKFLNDKVTQAGDIEVLIPSRDGEKPSGTVFSRPDGSYVGITMPTLAMPSFPVDEEEREMSITLDVKEFMGAVDVLLASAPKGHGDVTFFAKNSALVVQMPSAAGGEDEYPLEVSTESGLGDTSFSIDYAYIKSLSDLFDLDTIELGVHKRGRGGYVSFLHEDGGEKGNRYFTVIVWRK